MNSVAKLPWIYNVDSFADESEHFKRDVAIRIIGTKQAASHYLQDEASKRIAKLEPHLETVTGSDRLRVVEAIVDVQAEMGDQQKFLSNMALVAILARLTYALKKMASHGDTFVPRKKGSYRKDGDSEFQEIWREYQKRFEIDLLTTHQDRVAYLEPLRLARNRIVHYGGEANSYLNMNDMNTDLGDVGMLDLTFSGSYPQFVEGAGIGAEVVITESQLGLAIDASFDLMDWLSAALREKELAFAHNEVASADSLPA